MPEAFICDAVRTPIGRYGGALAPVRPDDLAAIPIRALVARHPAVDWARVDDVILGCANQAGEDNRNVARMAALLSGLPVEISGATVNRLCGSGLDAVATAARLVRGGEADLVVAGGVESMSRAPFVLGKADAPFARDTRLYDTTIGWRFVNPRMHELFGTDAMGETAENVAEEWKVARADQDAFALRSQLRARAAQKSGRLAREIVPVPVARGKETVEVTEDEHPRDTTLEALARLRPAFRTGGTVTAGNASGVNDGAAALLVASEGAARAYGLTPRARIVAGATAGVPPRVMGIGPVPATRKLLARAGLDLGADRRGGAERGVRGPGARGAPRPRAPRRRGAREPERRRHRPRPPARDERRAPGDDGDVRARGAGWPLRRLHDVHRRRSGHRGPVRARLSRIAIEAREG